MLIGPKTSAAPVGDEKLWNIDQGTTEIWHDGRLVALVVVYDTTVNPVTERWAIFHGGAKTPDGTLLGAWPDGDLPPVYDTEAANAAPIAGPVTGRPPWHDLHQQPHADWSAFIADVVARVAQKYSLPVGGAAGATAAQRIRAEADVVDGAWTRLTLAQPLIDQLVAAEHKQGGTGNHRRFKAQVGPGPVAWLYGEHRTAAGARRLHQIGAQAGIVTGNAPVSLLPTNESNTLPRFLTFARGLQDDPTKAWTYTRGDCTWHD